MNIKMDKAKMVTTREYMMKLIYQVNINKQDIKELEMVTEEFFVNNLEYIENRYKELRLQYSNKSELNLENMSLENFVDEEYVNNICEGFKEKSEIIDEMIDKNANNWTVNRMPKVDVSILRLAVCEIICENNIPTKVSINEAIELSKEYCDDKGPKFINGILGSVVSELQQ